MKINIFGLIFSFLIAIVPAVVFGEDITSQSYVCLVEQMTLGKTNPFDSLEGRGCCSWHGGVCGCQSGRAVCCDGSLSPSCGC